MTGSDKEIKFDEETEQQYFQIISKSGMAKSCHIEAIQLAKKGKIGEAQDKMKEGNEFYLQCHHIHSKMISEEASGKGQEISLILIHAEDQMASCEITKLMAEEFINLYSKLS